jgi:surfeit locus 1 family protein
MARPVLTPRIVVGGALALLVALACFGLGRWQLRRLEERRALNAAISRALESAPRPLGAAPAGDPSQAPTFAYRRVRVTGTYDQSREVVVFGRHREGVAGNEVLTPLRLSGGGALLVDRGWVPLSLDTPPIAEAPPPAGRVEVTGILWPAEAEADPTPASTPVAQLREVDIGRIRAQLPYPVAPVYLRLQSQRPTQPRSLPERVPLPRLDEGPHLSYALQWFTFGAIAVIGYVVLARREIREGSRGKQHRPRAAH